MSKGLNYLIVMPRLVQNIGDGYSFPLGLPYISSTMKKQGHSVKTLNLNHHEGNVLDIIQKEIIDNKIDVLATGGLSFQYTTIKEVVDAAKKADKRIKTIVGGGIITADPEPSMNALENVDYGVFGEGEKTICELCDALEKKGDISKVDGLIYKNGGRYNKTNIRKEIEDIDSIPWPDYEGFEFEKFLLTSPSISGINKKNTAFMIASRSCPYSCTFCFHTVGKKYRQRSLDNFFEEVDHMISKYNLEYICLADELFSVDPKRVEEFCNRIKPYHIKWWAQFRVDQISKNPQLLPILKDAGCDVMSFGIESADNRILKSMKKKITIEETEKALKLVYDNGMHLEGAFIFGDIEETWETANNTLKWWKDHSEYKITLNLITIYPGTPLYNHAYNNGLIKDKVKFLKEGCPQINVSKLKDNEVSKLVKEIIEAPLISTKTLTTSKTEIVDYKTGRIKVSGECSVCKEKNYWGDVKLFSSSFLACNQCGQRYNLLLSEEIVSNIDNNLTRLLDEEGRLAVWGINYHVTNLFKKSEVLKNENIYPIEISNMKRLVDLYGKRVNPPDIIDLEKIKTVIVPIPAYINEITGRIKKNHKDVNKIIDICELINPNYSK